MSRLKTLIKRVNASQIPDKHMMASALEKCAGDAGRKAHISAVNETLLAFGAMRLKGQRQEEDKFRLYARLTIALVGCVAKDLQRGRISRLNSFKSESQQRSPQTWH
jgi:hypothetical protein